MWKNGEYHCTCGTIFGKNLKGESPWLLVHEHLQKCRGEWDRIWRHFDRMQKRVMATKTSKEEFFAQPEDERMAFYEWLQQQCGGYSCYM